jgi:hypothetical protein
VVVVKMPMNLEEVEEVEEVEVVAEVAHTPSEA